MLVQPNAPKPKLIGLRIWPKAIPQFNVGHQEVIQVRLSTCHFVAARGRNLCAADCFLWTLVAVTVLPSPGRH